VTADRLDRALWLRANTRTSSAYAAAFKP